MNVGSMGPSNQIQFNITLKPAGTRPPADADGARAARVMIGDSGRADLRHQSAEHSASAAAAAETSYQYTLRGPDITQLYDQGERLLRLGCRTTRCSAA